jgi:hypothetical protein
MPERFNGAVSKTVGQATAPGVRIPLSPPSIYGFRSVATPVATILRWVGVVVWGAATLRESTSVWRRVSVPDGSRVTLTTEYTCGEMRERLNRRDWKSRGRATVPRVRIPLSPPPNKTCVALPLLWQRFSGGSGWSWGAPRRYVNRHLCSVGVPSPTLE